MKYKALVNIGTKPMIEAGQIFDGDRLNEKDKFIKAGLIVALPEEEKEEVKQDG